MPLEKSELESTKVKVGLPCPLQLVIVRGADTGLFRTVWAVPEFAELL